MGTSSTAPRFPFPSGKGFLYHRACKVTPERVTNDNAGSGGDSRSVAPSPEQISRPKRTRIAKPSPLGKLFASKLDRGAVDEVPIKPL